MIPGACKIAKITTTEQIIKKVKRFRSSFIANFFIFFLIFLEDIEVLAAVQNKPETPTRIRADIIDIKRKSQTIDFIHNVVVEKDDSSMLAQKMKVVYAEKGQGEDESKIKRIDASENVKIFSEEFIASGDSGYFEPDKNSFTLEKNVVVNNGSSIASGDKFIYNLTTKKGNFVGKKEESLAVDNKSDGRVVIIIGDEAKKQKKSKAKDE